MLLDPLTKEQQDEILAQFGYTKEKLETDLVILKEWLKKQHHLPPSRLKEKDSFLRVYITACKGNLDKAKKKLDAYYTFRSHCDLFSSRDPLAEDYSLAKEYFYLTILPALSKNNKLARILILSMADADVNHFDVMSYARKLLSIGELRIRLEEISIKDFIIIDCKGCSAGHVLKVKPLILRDLARLAQELLPYRYITVLFINAPSLVEMALNKLVKPFLSKKLKERIIITTNDYEEIYKYFDKSSLPKDYGGDNSGMKEINENWHKKEAEERDWYLNELSERCDESKRNLNLDIMNSSFIEFNGTFKQLDID